MGVAIYVIVIFYGSLRKNKVFVLLRGEKNKIKIKMISDFFFKLVFTSRIISNVLA